MFQYFMILFLKVQIMFLVSVHQFVHYITKKKMENIGYLSNC